jgi:predicted nucleic-acid-binding protein
MKILDANIILRYLIRDNEQMALYAKELIKNNAVTVTIEVIAEVVYVLNKVYQKDRASIANVLVRFIGLDNIICERDDIVTTALQTYTDNNLDFVDCILYAYHKELGYEVCTFDKKLSKLIER